MQNNLSKQKQVGKYAKKKKGSFRESDLQKACEQVLDTMRLCYIRIPDTMNSIVFGSPSIPVHVKKMISDITKGVPDLTILFEDGTYLAIELKTDTGKMSIGQKRFRNRIGELNYHVVRSLGDFVRLVSERKP